MNNFLWIIIIMILIFYIYNYIKTDENISRKYINKIYEKSKEIHISEKFKTKLNKKKLVKKLNKISEGFDNIEYKYILKLYYADWCPHCVDFKPIWESLKKKYNTLQFISIDCTNFNPNLPYVNGFPTIAIFNKNNEYIKSYEEERSYIKFDNYLKSILI